MTRADFKIYYRKAVIKTADLGSKTDMKPHGTEKKPQK